MLPTEAVLVIIIAQRVIWLPVAEAVQLDQPIAQAMMSIPAAETTPMDVVKQIFGTDPPIFNQQRANCDARIGRDDQCIRSRRRESKCAGHHAIQQDAADRSRDGHGSPVG